MPETNILAESDESNAYREHKRRRVDNKGEKPRTVVTEEQVAVVVRKNKDEQRHETKQIKLPVYPPGPAKRSPHGPKSIIRWVECPIQLRLLIHLEKDAEKKAKSDSVSVRVLITSIYATSGSGEAISAMEMPSFVCWTMHYNFFP